MPEDKFTNHKSNVIDFMNRQRLKCHDPNRVVARGSYGVDEHGEIVYDVLSRPTYENGSGFVISYTAKMTDFIVKEHAGAVVRVFLFLAHNQTFADSNTGQFGFRCTRKHIAQVLDLDPKSVYNVLKFLQDEFLVVETRVNGAFEYMVNPNYVTIGRSKKEREAEWSRRWAEHWKQKYNKQ